MKRGTKIGWLLIAVSIMLSVWVIISTSSVADTTDANGYTMSDDGTILKGIPSGPAIAVPNGVEIIADDVFKDNHTITSVSIPNSVTSLGTGFQDCTALSSVSLGSGITSIPAETFYNCTSLRIADLPASVTSVHPDAYKACTGMVGFTLSGGSNTFKVGTDGCLYSLDGTTLINVPDGKTSITIPAECTTIAAGAFNNSEITSLTIPETVTSIGTQENWDPAEIRGVAGSAAENYVDASQGSTQFIAIDGGNGGGSATSYEITEGANQTWTKGSGSNLTITGNGDFSNFIGVQIDGTTIGTENYTAASGSTIVTLNGSYLETLTNGNHTFTIVWNDGTASTTLTVQAANGSTDPSTPGNSTGYTITSGAGGTWTKGSGGTYSFIGSGPLSEFAGIKVDGTTVGASNYSATTSPTIITLSNAYLESLSVGTHSVTVVWTGGTATANFTVAAAGTTGKDSTGTTSKTTTTTTTKTSTGTGTSHTKDSTPKTADFSIDPRYFLALGVMLAGIAIVINGREKQINYVNKRRNE